MRQLTHVDKSSTRVKCLIHLLHARMHVYGVATISRLLKIIGLFCRNYLFYRAPLQKRPTIWKEPTTHSHPIRACNAWIIYMYYILIHLHVLYKCVCNTCRWISIQGSSRMIHLHVLHTDLSTCITYALLIHLHVLPHPQHTFRQNHDSLHHYYCYDLLHHYYCYDSLPHYYWQNRDSLHHY